MFESALLLWQEFCGTLWRTILAKRRSDAIWVSYEEPMEESTWMSDSTFSWRSVI